MSQQHSQGGKHSCTEGRAAVPTQALFRGADPALDEFFLETDALIFLFLTEYFLKKTYKSTVKV